MSLTPVLLQNMDFEHAINALRAELPNDLIWLIDWIEELQPDADQQAIVAGAENHDLSGVDVDALGGALVESVAVTLALLAVLDDFPDIATAPETLRAALHVAETCDAAGLVLRAD